MSRITKQKAFVLEKGSGIGSPRRFFTLGICRCEGVSEDSGFKYNTPKYTLVVFELV